MSLFILKRKIKKNNAEQPWGQTQKYGRLARCVLSYSSDLVIWTWLTLAYRLSWLHYTTLHHSIQYYTTLNLITLQCTLHIIPYTIYHILYTIYHKPYTTYYTTLYTILYYAILYYTMLNYSILLRHHTINNNVSHCYRLATVVNSGNDHKWIPYWLQPVKT